MSIVPALLPLLAPIGALVADPVVALRSDRPPLTQDQARAMTPAALADALLAPGHPPIVERAILPEGMVPPPPGTPPLDVLLVGSATLDRASGFCVKRRWRVGNERGGEAQVIEAQPTLYQLPPDTGGCAARRSSYFTVSPADRPGAFTVVRLLADAVRRASTTPIVVSIDDREGRETARDCAEHPGSCDYPHELLTDGRRALAGLPVDAIFAVGRDGLFDANLLSPGDLTAPDGHRYENWKMFVSGNYTVNVALDGDRIVVIKMRRAIPPPF